MLWLPPALGGCDTEFAEAGSTVWSVAFLLKRSDREGAVSRPKGMVLHVRLP